MKQQHTSDQEPRNSPLCQNYLPTTPFFTPPSPPATINKVPPSIHCPTLLLSPRKRRRLCDSSNVVTVPIGHHESQSVATTRTDYAHQFVQDSSRTTTNDGRQVTREIIVFAANGSFSSSFAQEVFHPREEGEGSELHASRSGGLLSIDSCSVTAEGASPRRARSFCPEGEPSNHTVSNANPNISSIWGTLVASTSSSSSLSLRYLREAQHSSGSGSAQPSTTVSPRRQHETDSALYPCPTQGLYDPRFYEDTNVSPQQSRMFMPPRLSSPQASFARPFSGPLGKAVGVNRVDLNEVAEELPPPCPSSVTPPPPPPLGRRDSVRPLVVLDSFRSPHNSITTTPIIESNNLRKNKHHTNDIAFPMKGTNAPPSAVVAASGVLTPIPPSPPPAKQFNFIALKDIASLRDKHRDALVEHKKRRSSRRKSSPSLSEENHTWTQENNEQKRSFDFTVSSSSAITTPRMPLQEEDVTMGGMFDSASSATPFAVTENELQSATQLPTISPNAGRPMQDFVSVMYGASPYDNEVGVEPSPPPATLAMSTTRGPHLRTALSKRALPSTHSVTVPPEDRTQLDLSPLLDSTKGTVPYMLPQYCDDTDNSRDDAGDNNWSCATLLVSPQNVKIQKKKNEASPSITLKQQSQQLMRVQSYGSAEVASEGAVNVSAVQLFSVSAHSTGMASEQFQPHSPQSCRAAKPQSPHAPSKDGHRSNPEDARNDLRDLLTSMCRLSN